MIKALATALANNTMDTCKQVATSANVGDNHRAFNWGSKLQSTADSQIGVLLH